MITISSRVGSWIKAHPFHASFMAQGLINTSALAREIRPELESQAGEKLSLEAIILALNRQAKQQDDTLPESFEKFMGEVSVQTGLSILTIPQVNLDANAFFKALKAMHDNQDYALYTRGVWHTALIGKRHTIEELSTHFANNILNHDLVAITIKLKPGHLPTPGVCAYVLETLAHNGVNLTEVTSSHDELTVIIKDELLNTALHCLVKV